ncbi:MAG: DUF3276 family protein [Treponema sp.]|jgi:hypothetical protein|nr:DUF3276 family protein [Treponema sp.]
MGLRGELFSTRVLLPNRTYFFNVKENRMGDLYLNIVESKNRDTGGFDRQSVILFAEDLQEFLKGFDESLRVLEKEMRERRRASKAAARDAGDSEADGRHEKRGRHHGDDRGPGPAGGPEKPRRGRPPKDGKRVIVKRQRD